MIKKILLIGTLCAVAAVMPANAKSRAHEWAEVGVEASIPFASHNGIRNFETDGNDGIWLEDIRGRWYYAELMGPCVDLDFAQAIGYETRGSSQFDKFSSILVGRHECRVVKLVTAAKPLPRKERLTLRKQVREAGKDVVAPPAN